MSCNFMYDFTIAIAASSHTVFYFYVECAKRMVRGKPNYILDRKMVQKSQFVIIFVSKNIFVEFSNAL